MREREYDFVALGGGTAGLVSAVGARMFGARVALVEREALGGDCLWTGCVPSKAIIASARLAHEMRNAAELGLLGASPAHAFRSVMERVRATRARVAEHDDPRRFREMGIDVLEGEARFVGPERMEVEGVGRIRGRSTVIATGAEPTAPPIPGLAEAGYLTHATAFDQDRLPPSMVVLGGGPIGLEFAQVYARLGCRVTVLEMLDRLLPREDADVAAAVADLLEAEGIEVETGVEATGVEAGNGLKGVSTRDGRSFQAEEVFVATGRRPATEILEPERAGVERDGAAVRVDEKLRTTAGGIYAAGDVAGHLQFTHVAEAMAKVVLRNALFPLSRRVDYSAVPRVTYTDPEVAHVGLDQEAAAERGARTYRYDFSELDRSIAEGRTSGFVKISADKKGRILGASILGDAAGELIFPLVLAMEEKIPLSRISDAIFPYPTRMEGIKRASQEFQRERLEGPAGRFLRRVARWGM